MKAVSFLQKRQKTSSAATLTLLVLFIFLFVLFTYTFLHESGHAIIGFLFGQTLTEFDVNFLDFGAHVNMNGSLTEPQLTIQSMAGAGLPLLIWLMFIGLVPRKANFSLEVLKLLSSLIVLNTLLVWIVIPVLYLFGSHPLDDVTHFLLHSQMSPLLLIFTALVLYVCGWALFLSKIDGLQNALLLFRTTDYETLTAGTRTTIPVMAGILAFCILLTFLLKTSVEKRSALPASQDFVSIAEIDLSARSYAGKQLAQFTLEEPAEVDIFIIVRDINTTYFDLSVIGPNGYSSMVLHGEVYSAYQDSGSWKENLSAGTYQVVLTSHQSSGTASIYLKTP